MSTHSHEGGFEILRMGDGTEMCAKCSFVILDRGQPPKAEYYASKAQWHFAESARHAALGMMYVALAPLPGLPTYLGVSAKEPVPMISDEDASTLLSLLGEADAGRLAVDVLDHPGASGWGNYVCAVGGWQITVFMDGPGEWDYISSVKRPDGVEFEVDIEPTPRQRLFNWRPERKTRGQIWKVFDEC